MPRPHRPVRARRARGAHRPLPLIALGLLVGGAARADCAVDQLDAKINRRGDARREQVWIYAEAEPLPCRALRLPVDPGASLRRAKVRVRRGDRRDSRLGAERLRWADDGAGGLELQVHVPELAPGEVLQLDLRWRLDPGAGISWRPGAYGPASRPRLRIPSHLQRENNVEDDILSPERGEVGAVRWLRPSGARPMRPIQAPATVRLDLRPSGPGTAAEPPAGWATRGLRVALGPDEGGFFPWPAGVGATVCAAEGGAVAQAEPMGCRIFAEDSGVGVISAELPLAPSWDHGAQAWPGSPVQAATLALSIGGQPLDCAPGQPCAASLQTPGGSLALELRVEADPQRPEAGPLRGWLWSVGGAPVLDGPARLSELSARSALLASVPEPGLPLSLKHLDAESQPLPELCAAVNAWLGASVQVAAVPGQRPTAPRPLLRVRKEGVATDWELSLLLARHLRQLRVPATPLLLRPGPPADPASPFGWTASVVEVEGAAGPFFIAPSCRSCGEGELPAALWGAEVLGPTPRRLPPPPPGALAWTLAPGDGAQRLELQLSGPPGQALRAALAALPKAGRAAWLDGQLPGGRLEDHAGLDQPGAPITLRWRLPGGALPLPSLPGLDGQAPPASARFSLLHPRSGCPESEGEGQGSPPCVLDWALPAGASEADRGAAEAAWRAAQAPPPPRAPAEGPTERIPLAE